MSRSKIRILVKSINRRIDKLTRQHENALLSAAEAEQDRWHAIEQRKRAKDLLFGNVVLPPDACVACYIVRGIESVMNALRANEADQDVMECPMRNDRDHR